MSRIARILTLILLLLAIYFSFTAIMPTYSADKDSALTNFSTDRALKHVAEIGKEPHAIGFKAHADVKNYIVAELQKLGLKTTVQEGYTAGDWGNLSYASNILAKIKGKTSNKALLLLSHYDSNPHSSLGASDAGSGVATILESIRAYLEENKTPTNDIIILLSDGEELGLNGAELFVNKHPWAKNVGLALNFEARGSGGPSYMLIETNQGNGKLIEEFTTANPEYPVANSLAYSIYKMLPNDTDLTVFREDADIQGFNFAFIDDHFDYHTEKDNYERLDKKTLAHQGSYLMPLLHHFADTDLSALKTNEDAIYFTVPVFKTVSYPFSWIWPMFAIAVVLFIVITVLGLKNKTLDAKEIIVGFAPLLISILITGLVGYFSWTLLKVMYPQYKDILHGFTYNGYTYIAAFTLLALAICFYIYHKFKKLKTPNLVVAPLFIWLVISGLAAVYLKGASYTIVPVFALLVSFTIVSNQKKPNPYLLFFLTLPVITIFTPFVKMFPVGLGLNMLVASTVLTTLLFVAITPIFGFYKHKNRLALLLFILSLSGFAMAHFNSGFTKDNAKPSSLLYVLDANTNTAKWATYDSYLTKWTAQYVDDTKTSPKELANTTISSKYNSSFNYVANAAIKKVAVPKIEKTQDTLINNKRHLKICITPQRNVNRLDIYKNNVALEQAIVNGVALPNYSLLDSTSKFMTHYISNNNYTEISLILEPNTTLELTFFEASNDLLTNEHFSIPARPENEIPMPFVLNDAILIIKTVKF
ncbi:MULTISPECIES: M28 family peptidase [unclassified Cellulophaga]|uniref:M28 family peptidase n=1 Tax=unclassified Cellulophaga TaxID=2634405 RepID=UPI0026E15AA3|nr:MULTISPECIES: M28 family peptidase [unclassified Cellulophaga]MDO6489896.1 M28 family peptidase [Cellulophaga sp. 2_MG-2023]MDO6494910.1 M28 family peptidase [Cellulophaga sp. 3_MG-2023]